MGKRKVDEAGKEGPAQKVRRKDKGIVKINDKIPGTPTFRSATRHRLKKQGVYEEYVEWIKAAEENTYETFKKMRAERSGNQSFVKSGEGEVHDGLPGNKGVRAMTRHRLKKDGVYEEYYNDWFLKGKTLKEFRRMRAKRAVNYRFVRSEAPTDGKTRGKRVYDRIKERSQEMVAAGADPNETPLGKMQARSVAHANQPKQCKLCPLLCKNYNDLRYHVQRAHSANMIRLVNQVKGQELEDVKLIANALDGDLQWRASHYMMVTGSNVGMFVRWTGRGKDSTLTNALIDRPKFSTAATAYGIKWEKEAIRQYARKYGVAGVVAENRCFKHPTFAHVAATTDGLIGDEGLIEVKCPSKSISGMLKKRAGSGWYLHYVKVGNEKVLRLRRTSDHFYQCALQLVCSGRAFLDFVVAYRDNKKKTNVEQERWELWRERILAAEAAAVWEEKMEPKIGVSYSHASNLITIPDVDNEQEENDGEDGEFGKEE